MVIQCPDCRTRFKLADEKVKPEGTKVRCARCQGVFAVMPPPPPVLATENDEVPESGPEGKFTPGTAGVFYGGTNTAPALENGHEDDPWKEEERPSKERPEMQVERGEEDSFFLPDPAEGDEPFGAPPEEGPFASEDDPAAGYVTSSADFDPFSPGEEDADPLSAEGESFSAGRSGSITVEDESEKTAEDPESDPFQFPPSAAPDEGDGFYTEPDEKPGDEFSFGDEQGEPFSFEEIPGPAQGTSEASSEPDEFSFADEETASPAPPEKREENRDFSWTSGAGEDLFPKSPSQAPSDEFDFSPSSPEEGPASVQPDIPLAAVSPVEAPSPAVPPESPARQLHEKSQAPPSHKAPAPVRRKKTRSSGPLLLFLVLLLAVVAAAGFLFWRGGPEEVAGILNRLTPQEAPAPEAGQIRLADLKGYFVQNDQSGQLFVISGLAANDSPEARSAISIKGVLFNDKGAPLLQQTVFAGNPITESALRELPYSKIEESMNNQFGDSLSNLNVAPGKSIPFTIVFKDLPANLAEFTVEVADSRPGTQQ